MAEQLGFVREASKACRSRRWWRRLRGVRILTALEAGEEVVPRLAHDPHPLVRAEVVAWLSTRPSPERLGDLLGMLADPAAVARFGVQDALLNLGASAVGPLARYLREMEDPDCLVAALEVARGLAAAEFLEPGLALAGAPQAEVRAEAARLLGALGGEPGAQRLLELLADPEATVRAAAAESLGRLSERSLAPQLARLLSDPSWQVRKRAGLALRCLGSPGKVLLRKWSLEAESPAGVMARHVLGLPEVVAKEVRP